MKTITQERSIEIHEFNDVVYIKFNGFPKKDFECLRKKEFKKIPKKTLIERLESGDFDYEKRLHWYTDEYLEHYREGDWDWYPANDSPISLDPLPFLQNGEFENLYMGYAGLDGYIYHLDGRPVLRKIECEFWATYYVDNLPQLAEYLKAHKKWSGVEFVDQTCSLNVDITGLQYLVGYYMPTQADITKWIKRSKRKYGWQAEVGGSYGLIHDMKYIAKYHNELSN